MISYWSGTVKDNIKDALPKWMPRDGAVAVNLIWIEDRVSKLLCCFVGSSNFCDATDRVACYLQYTFKCWVGSYSDQ